MKAVVFLGPSLPLETARTILDAVYLPPARQGSLVSAIEIYQPDAVGLVDGLFLQDLSVWHKEILFAIERGVRVFGASSMGALRAAELAPFGMVGIGWVYEQYARGAITGDDEVALAHSSPESGYRKISEPLVNFRATLLAAQSEGLLSAADCDRAVALAKTIYFPERSMTRIFRALEEGGFEESVLGKLQRYFAERYVDAKGNDAILLLETLRDRAFAPEAPRLPEKFARTRMFEVLYQRDRTVERGGGRIPLSSIARHAALHRRDFESLRFQALNRELAVFAARVLGLEASEEELQTEVRRFRAARSLACDADLTAWLGENDLSAGEFQNLIRDLARCRKAQRWWLAVLGRREGKAKSVLDELRLSDRYGAVAAEACAALEPDGEDGSESASTARDFIALAREHMAATDFRVLMPIEAWAEEAGFVSLEDLALELLRAKRRRAKPAMQEVP